MSFDWEEYRLGDVTEWSSGGTPSKKNDDFWSGDIPWISASSMKGTRYSNSDLKITEAGLRAGSRLAEKDTILLLVRGSALHQRILVGITECDVSFNQDVKAIKPKAEFLDSWYLLFWFMSIEKTLLNMVENTGIGAGKLETKLLQNLIIKIPPKAERERIKACAKAIDDKLIVNRQTNQTLEHIAQAIFKSWFIDFDPTRAKISAKQSGQDPERAAMVAISGKVLDELDQLSSEQLEQLRVTAALFPDALVDSELGEVPKGWKVQPLSKYIDVKHGYAFKGEYFSDAPTDNILLTPGNFKIGGGFKFDKLKYYQGPMPDDYILERNDLIITMTDLSKQSDTLGFPALVSEVGNFTFLHNQRLGKVVSKEGVLKNYFMYFLLKSHRYRSEIVGGATGTTVKHTAPKKILSYTHPFQGELENVFDLFAESVYSRIESNMNENESLIQIRDTLLPKLLSGELSARLNAEEVA